MTHVLTPQDLTTLRTVTDPAVSDDGRLVAGSVHDPASDDAPARADLWISVDGAPARPVTSGPGVDALPRIAPSGRRLAFGSDRAQSGHRGLFLIDLDDSGAALGEPRHVAAVTGVVEDIHWSADERHLLLRVADPGSDTGNVGGGIRFSGDDAAASIAVHRPGTYRRRAVLLDLDTEEATPISPGDLTVWDLGWAGAADGPIAALVSADATESGWYDAHVVRLDADGSTETLYRPDWQLQEPVISPDGRRLAVLEGPQSDRALLSGEVVILDLHTRDVQRVPLDVDVSRLRWLADGDLFWAGRASLDSVVGRIHLDDAGRPNVRETWRGRQTLGSTYRVQAAVSADGTRVAAARQAHGVPWELAVLDPTAADPTWLTLTDVNAHATAWPVPEEQPFTWVSEGQDVHGLLLTPPGAGADPLPLVVVPHGGPTNASTSVFASGAHGGDALLLTQAGCAVLVPNPRGSVGRGRDFMAANIGDLGGGDLRDIEAGVAALVDAGRVDAARVGIVGLSYGGFMSAWAAVRSRAFAAAIPIAGISDWLSFHHTSNQGRMDEIFLDSSPYDPTGRHLERSPIMHVRGCTTATLILHGDADLACPIGQAQEFYQGLADAGSPVEYVVYRGAGHGMTTREHRIDVQERILAWFGEHLGLSPTN